MARPALPTIPARESRRLDRNAEELGVPVSQLMARAGKALASAVQRRMGKGVALFLCGKGNNGGDGLAAAYLLQKAGRDARVVLAEPREAMSPPARTYLELLPADRVSAWAGRWQPAWSKADVLVDCLLGSGLAGDPRPPYDALIAQCNRLRRKVPIVACDVPSGLGSRLAVRPHETVTFHAAKEGMTPANAGRIRVEPIGIPREAETHVGLGDLEVGYPRPRPDSHKGDNGIVLAVVGGPYLGAPYYAGMSAYRTGADLVHAFMPEEAARAVSAFGPHLMVHAVEPGSRLTPLGVAAVVGWMDRAGRNASLLVGPGLGDSPVTREAASQVMAEAARRGMPIVVDADGLDAVTPELLRRHGARMVLTPHSREFLDLAGEEPTEVSVQRYAARNGNATVLWKRQGTFITDGVQRRLCDRGHPTMTVGGTGDVLAGSVAALLAKGAPPFEAACMGAYLTGSAGELAAALRSYGATATDVLEAIPAVLLRMRT